MIRALPLALLLGCGSNDAPDARPETKLCTEVTNHGTGSFFSAVRLDDGTVFASTEGLGLRIREPDGTWLEPDPMPIAGLTERDGTVFGRDVDGVHRWTGTNWEPLGEPLADVEPWEVFEVGLHALGTDEVVLLAQEQGCSDCTGVQVPLRVWRWDGTGWSSGPLGLSVAYAFDSAMLPDGTLLIATDRDVLREDGSVLSTSPDGEVRVLVADDAGLVLVGTSGHVGIGDASGLDWVPHDFDTTPNSLWGSGPDDVWAQIPRYALGAPAESTVAHWDGTEWAELPLVGSYGRGLVIGADGEVLVLGDERHEASWVGGPDGFTAERSISRAGLVKGLAVDDQTGFPWMIGNEGTLAWHDGNWQSVHLDGLPVAVDTLAVTEGRVAVSRGTEELFLYDGGELMGIETNALQFLAGAEGTLFAASDQGVHQNMAGTWDPVDLTGYPATASVRSAWADDASTLWVGLDTGAGGAIALWDGATWTVPIEGLRDVPTWIRRMGGVLYFGIWVPRVDPPDSGVWSWDGATAAPVDLPPALDAARTDAGQWGLLRLLPEGHDDFYALEVQLDGGWTTLATSGSLPLAATNGERLWLVDGTTTHAVVPCE